jgi:hypothetical protein
MRLVRISEKMEEKTLKIGTNENVHGRRESLFHVFVVYQGIQRLVCRIGLLPLFVCPSLKEAMKDIVFICGNDEVVDGKAHTFGIESRQNISKISSRDTMIAQY